MFVVDRTAIEILMFYIVPYVIGLMYSYYREDIHNIATHSSYHISYIIPILIDQSML